MTVAAFAPAKVNLFLHVGAPGADGYHPLCSLMAFADVGDRLEVGAGETLRLAVEGPYAGVLAGGGDNLVLRAVRALASLKGEPEPAIELVLTKTLPVAAGLGGGSSDAGAALRLLRGALTDEALEAVAASLGADGAACLWGRATLAQGRGERLSPAPAMPTLAAVLVNPRVEVSTPAVYRALDETGKFGEVTPPTRPQRFENPAEVAAWLRPLRNDLEAPAVALAPVIGEALDILAAEPETLLARMSGSGATCFALCSDEDAARELAIRLWTARPDWWVRPCRIGGPWPDPA